MEVWQIVLLVLIIGGFIYVTGLLYVGSHARRFHLSLKRRVVALNILSLEKRETLLGIHEICANNDVVYSSSDEEAIAKIKTLSFDKANHAQAKSNLSALKSCQSHLAYLAQKNPNVRADARYETYLATLEDVDRNVRQVSSLYNADTLGYNYWLGIPLFRWLPFIMGYRRREPIN